MSEYTRKEAQDAADLAEKILLQLEGYEPAFACHTLSVVMATLVANEVSVLARGYVVKEMQERFADDVAKMAKVADKGKTML